MKEKSGLTKIADVILRRSWALTATQFVFIITFANLVLYHYPLFSFIVSHLDISTNNGILTLLIVVVIITAFTAVIFLLLFTIGRWLALPLIIMIAMINASALYFMVNYQIVLDKTMIANIFNTRVIESNQYFSFDFFIYLLVFGIVPAGLILKIKIKKISRLRLLFHVLITLVITVALVYSNAATSLWIDKNASKLGSRILPWSYIINTTDYLKGRFEPPVKRGRLPDPVFDDDKKRVVVLVIGETARAQNFSLYGYDKPTNPLLSQAGIVTLNDPTACSTYTTASISCMLSHTDSNPDHYEILPDYLSRNNVDVIWHSNNWGQPPLTVQTYLDSKALGEQCTGAACDYDEKLLTGLKQRIESSDKQKILVVLHMTGSHGPSYYSKYPADFEVFKPVCKSLALDKCTQQELINAYDNTILYTDYFLVQVIKLLQDIPATSSVMMYMSDHGESLGEYGLYLHGTPFTIAPDVQKKVPFLLWMSDLFQEDSGLANTNFQQQSAHSQHHVFHSVLGALSISSGVYKPELDIFRDRQSMIKQPHHKP